MNKLFFKYLGFIFTILLLNNELYAQTLSDGLRFSQTVNGGTARFVSMGGAFGALGADFSSLSINPAGLGVYKSSEFSITPTFKRNKFSSTYGAISASDTKNKLGFDNLGLVMSFKPYKSSENGIVNFNIGFGYTRTNDFNANSIALGNYDEHSIMDYFTAKANSEGMNPDILSVNGDYDPYYELGSNLWDMVMAWDTWLLFAYDDASQSFQSALFEGDSVKHKNIISTQGGSGEYDFSFAMNISNKLYIGATLGVTDFSYTYNATYSEDAYEANPYDANGDRFFFMDYSQFYETQGTGYNLKIGAIYNPIPSLRVGATIHTPTFYSFDDTYSSIMKSNFDVSNAETNFSSKTPLGKYDYKFETPFKIIGSIAYVIDDVGLLSLDVERVDYSSMKFRSGGDGYSFSDENLAIGQAFKSVTNFRVGGEYRIENLSLRAGYAFYPSPYSKGFLNDNSKTTQFSGGFGYRFDSFSVDMAYLHTVKDENYLFYDYQGLPPVNTSMSDSKFLVTFGFRF